jgi:hypothetical protein
MQVEVLFYPVGWYPHAWEVKGIRSLQVKDLVTADGNITTSFELFVGSKHMVSYFIVFGCPCIAKK